MVGFVSIGNVIGCIFRAWISDIITTGGFVLGFADDWLCGTSDSTVLGLTDKEEDQIVAFLEPLTDGYTAPYPNSDTFTGNCIV